MSNSEDKTRDPFHASLPTGEPSLSDRVDQIIDSLSAHGYLNVKDDRDYGDIETIVSGVLVALNPSETRAGEQEGSTAAAHWFVSEEMCVCGHVKGLHLPIPRCGVVLCKCATFKVAPVQTEGGSPPDLTRDDVWWNGVFIERQKFIREWGNANGLPNIGGTLLDTLLTFWAEIHQRAARSEGGGVAAQAAEIAILQESERGGHLRIANLEKLLKDILDTVNLQSSVSRSSPLDDMTQIPWAIRDLQNCYADAAMARNGLYTKVQERAEAAETLVGELRTENEWLKGRVEQEYRICELVREDLAAARKRAEELLNPRTLKGKSD